MLAKDKISVDHFVITRFNLKKLGPHFQKDKNGNATQTEAWLTHRFKLFETYCIPSLRGQTCQGFKWIVLFDVDTPALYKGKIEGYQKAFSNFCPLYLETGETEYLRQSLRDAIHSMSHQYSTFIITTRIDNDDAFNIDMIKDVQTTMIGKTDCFLNYNYGVQYDAIDCLAVKMRDESNHFLSRIERNSSQLETVITHDHTHVDKVSKVLSIDNKNRPMWVEVVHESNVGNWLRLSMPIFSDKYFERFNLNVSINKQKSIVLILRFLKFRTYVLFASIFTKILTKIGLLEQFKKAIS